MSDDRVAYGMGCMWWDGIEKVGKTRPEPSPIPPHPMISIPCCPHCRGPLMEMPSPVEWWAGVERYQANGHPGYRDFVEWLKGKCYPDRETAKAAYEASGRRTVVL